MAHVNGNSKNRTHILRFNLTLKLTFSPYFIIDIKGKVKLKWSGEYGTCMIVNSLYSNTHILLFFSTTGICWLIVTLVKILFVLLTEYYYKQIHDPEYCSCSPKSHAVVPYIIGVKAYDITFTSIAMVIEVFVPLVFIAVFHWRVRRLLYVI